MSIISVISVCTCTSTLQCILILILVVAVVINYTNKVRNIFLFQIIIVL